jgi:hypothetical protein
LPVARKRDVITTALESLGLSSTGTNVDKRFKLPEIPPSTESALNIAPNVATIGGGIAKIWHSLDESSSNSKREWDTASHGIGLERPPAAHPLFDGRELRNQYPPTCGAQIYGGGLVSTKREFLDALHGVDITTLLDGVTPQFEDRSIPSIDIPSYHWCA